MWNFEVLEKARRNLARLSKKQVINKRGVIQTVYVSSREDVEDKRLNKLLAKEKNTPSEVLSNFPEDHPAYPLFHELCLVMKDQGIAPSIRKVSDEHMKKELGGDVADGYYDSKTGDVFIAKESEFIGADPAFVVTHECLHALTFHKLRDEKNKKFRKTFDKMREHAKKYLGDKFEYELSNNDEFVVGIFTEPEFIMALEKVPAMNDKKYANLLEELYNYLLESLGIKGSSFAEQAASVSSQVILGSKTKPIKNKVYQNKNSTMEKSTFEKALETISLTADKFEAIAKINVEKAEGNLHAIKRLVHPKDGGKPYYRTYWVADYNEANKLQYSHSRLAEAKKTMEEKRKRYESDPTEWRKESYEEAKVAHDKVYNDLESLDTPGVAVKTEDKKFSVKTGTPEYEKLQIELDGVLAAQKENMEQWKNWEKEGPAKVKEQAQKDYKNIWEESGLQIDMNDFQGVVKSADGKTELLTIQHRMDYNFGKDKDEEIPKFEVRLRHSSFDTKDPVDFAYFAELSEAMKKVNTVTSDPAKMKQLGELKVKATNASREGDYKNDFSKNNEQFKKKSQELESQIFAEKLKDVVSEIGNDPFELSNKFYFETGRKRSPSYQYAKVTKKTPKQVTVAFSDMPGDDRTFYNTKTMSHYDFDKFLKSHVDIDAHLPEYKKETQSEKIKRMQDEPTDFSGWSDKELREYYDDNEARIEDYKDEMKRGNKLDDGQKKDLERWQKRLSEATAEIGSRKKAKKEKFESNADTLRTERAYREIEHIKPEKMTAVQLSDALNYFNSVKVKGGLSPIGKKKLAALEQESSVRELKAKTPLTGKEVAENKAKINANLDKKVALMQERKKEAAAPAPAGGGGGGKKVVNHDSYDHPSGGKINKGDKVTFDHKGTMKTGTVVTTNKYDRFPNPYVKMKGEDGKVYEIVISKVNKSSGNLFTPTSKENGAIDPRRTAEQVRSEYDSLLDRSTTFSAAQNSQLQQKANVRLKELNDEHKQLTGMSVGDHTIHEMKLDREKRAAATKK